jgi:hypothetical protein
MKRIHLKLIILFFTSVQFTYGQSAKETLDYINFKQEAFKFKNNEGDIFQYAINITDTLGRKSIVIAQIASIAGLIVRKDYLASPINKIVAVEASNDEIGRPQIKIFADNPGFYKWDLLNNTETFDSIIEITLSKNTDTEQMKTLVNAYGHLIYVNGGKDLKDKFK